MLSEVLDKYGAIGVSILKDAVWKVSSSGETAESIRFESDDKSLQIFGRFAFASLETGRGPRKESAYGEFDKHMEEWLQAKGFQSKTSKSGVQYFKMGSQWFSAKSLAWKINKEGDKKWRQGHGARVRNVYSKELEKFVKELEGAVIQDQFQNAKTAVMDSLKVA
jgi:hypothetical protein